MSQGKLSIQLLLETAKAVQALKERVDSLEEKLSGDSLMSSSDIPGDSAKEA